MAPERTVHSIQSSPTSSRLKHLRGGYRFGNCNALYWTVTRRLPAYHYSSAQILRHTADSRKG